MILDTLRVEPASLVLGLAYDSQAQRLYVLDVDDDHDTWPLRYARLLRIDVSRGTSTVVWRVPYTGLYSSVALSALEDGTVALVAGTSLGYTAWRLDAAGQDAVFRGVRVGLGRVVDDPVMGEDRLYLPVHRGSAIELDEIQPSGFLPGAACTGL
ncbi:MAG: hypothetical protein FJ104_08600 [Deltaproteobacteria bacterium]|nr:hypothetical protein [Deltaproteobacteria bacterium]